MCQRASSGKQRQSAAGGGAPSKLNCPGSVPATPLTLTITGVCAVEPPYAGGAHATVVADLQAVLLHNSATARVAVGVKADPPKLRPLIVTDPPAVPPTFGGLLTLTQGAGTQTTHDPNHHELRSLWRPIDKADKRDRRRRSAQLFDCSRGRWEAAQWRVRSMAMTSGASSRQEMIHVGHACHRRQLASCPTSSYHRS
jgi:hypothetical protein